MAVPSARGSIEARRLWRPLYLLPIYAKEQAYRIEVAQTLYAEAISLPSSVGLSERDQQEVIRCVEEFVRS